MRQRDVKHQDFTLERGFSLMEVLIAMAVSTIVMFAIYTTFASGAGTYAKGDVKADIHQNTRASMGLMVREIRLAGYFPENVRDFLPPPPPPAVPVCGPAGISIAAANQITMCGDIDGDNSSDEITYCWIGDTDLDGVVDPDENEIWRQVNDNVCNPANPPQVNPAGELIAFNICAFSLTYFDAANAGIGGGPPVGVLQCPPVLQGPPVTAANLANIRRVAITLIGSEPLQQSAAIGGRSPSPFATRVRNYQLVTDARPRNLGL